jgi:LysM repeat protein
MKFKISAFIGTVSAQALILAGVFMQGCSSPEVLMERPYIPAPVDSDELVLERISRGAGVETVEFTEVDIIAPQAPAAPVMPDLPPLESIETTTLTHTVKKGDSLWKIARSYGVSIDELVVYNKIAKDKVLLPGSTINIPPGGRVLAPSELKPVKPRKTTATAKRTSGVSKIATKKAEVPSDGWYVVKSGDSLGSIASRFQVKMQDLAKLNNIQRPYIIRAGQRLRVPGGKVDVAPVTASAQKSAPAAAAPVASTDKAAQQKEADAILKNIPDGSTTTASEKSLLKELDINLDFGKTKNIEVLEDTNIDAFSVKHGVKVQDVRRLNPEIGPDGKLYKGNIVMIPE